MMTPGTFSQRCWGRKEGERAGVSVPPPPRVFNFCRSGIQLSPLGLPIFAAWASSFCRLRFRASPLGPTLHFSPLRFQFSPLGLFNFAMHIPNVHTCRFAKWDNLNKSKIIDMGCWGTNSESFAVDISSSSSVNDHMIWIS